MKILLTIFILFFAASNGQTAEKAVQDCSELTQDCEYYLCLETQKQCGSQGYLKSFGHKYCNRFQKYTQFNVSPKAQLWLSDVRSCLIRKLEEINQGLTCSELKQAAFKSHVPCYIEAKFCNLNYKDKYQIIRAIGRALRKPQVLRAGLRVLRSCRLIRLY